jgi:hypothetical protein
MLQNGMSPPSNLHLQVHLYFISPAILLRRLFYIFLQTNAHWRRAWTDIPMFSRHKRLLWNITLHLIWFSYITVHYLGFVACKSALFICRQACRSAKLFADYISVIIWLVWYPWLEIRSSNFELFIIYWSMEDKLCWSCMETLEYLNVFQWITLKFQV